MKLIGYARVSTEDQRQEGHSLAEQEERIKAYARCHPDQELEIVVESGVVVQVNGLPFDWTFHITDNDSQLEDE